MKRGQISLFVIFGIVIILGMGAFIYYSSNVQTEALEEAKEEVLSSDPLLAKPVEEFITSCLRKTAQTAILELGRRGGFFVPPLTSDPLSELPDFKAYFPNNDDRFSSIATYIDAALPVCYGDFAQFSEQFEVSVEEPYTLGVLSDTVLTLTLSLPVKVQAQEEIAQLDTFEIQFDVRRMQEMFTVAQAVAQAVDENGVCVDCFAEITFEKNVSVGYSNTQNGFYLFELTHEESPYILNFVVEEP